MKRAKSLKGETQISFGEIKQLIRQLEQAIQQAPDKWKRDRTHGTYSFFEVAQTADALRHLLMSVEVMKKAAAPGTPPLLREKARLQLLKAVLAI